MNENLAAIAIGVVIVLGVLSLLVWLSPGDGSDQTGYGNWYKIANPPGLTADHECWVWQGGFGDAKHGGPLCFIPHPIPAERG